MMTPKELRELRESFSLTQKELARIIRSTQETISRWESGERQIGGIAETAIRSTFQLMAIKKQVF